MWWAAGDVQVHRQQWFRAVVDFRDVRHTGAANGAGADDDDNFGADTAS